MKNIHIVISDLFLPADMVAQTCADLELPALETLLARAQPQELKTGALEAWLGEAFGVDDQSIAAITLRAEGLEQGAYCWMRADPVHLHLQRDQMILQSDIPVNAEEAEQLCANLNTHFAEDGLHFLAPHPQRWYLRLDHVPDMATRPLSQVAGRNIHPHLPKGADALKWHGVFNEIQMFFFEHPVNQAREARGELPVNSVWLWGEGEAVMNLAQPFSMVYGDSPLADAFAHAAAIPHGALPDDESAWLAQQGETALVVWDEMHRAIQRGDLHEWRASLQRFEQRCAAPALAALRGGRIAQITLDVLNGDAAQRFVLTRPGAWKVWRRPKSLAQYAVN